MRNLAILIAVAGATFAILFFTGHATEALRHLGEGVTPYLYALLSAAVAGILTVLVKKIGALGSESPPLPPLPPDNGSPADKSGAPGGHVQLTMADTWETYVSGVNASSRQMKEENSTLTTRQAVYLVTLFGILCLAIVVCAAGFVAITNVTKDGSARQLDKDTFLPHLEYLIPAFAAVGLALGAVVFGIRQNTDLLDALFCCTFAAEIVGLVSVLVSLPYVYPQMWKVSILFLGLDLPMLFWMVAFRILVGPMICATGGLIGFGIINLLSHEKLRGYRA